MMMSINYLLVCILIMILNISDKEENNKPKGTVESVSVPNNNQNWTIQPSPSRPRSRKRPFKSKSRLSYFVIPTNRDKYKSVVPKGRIVDGSSPYTSNNWRSAAESGVIFGGREYIDAGNVAKPTICTNNDKLRPNSDRTYGYFVCPLGQMKAGCKYCCGGEKEEYCCDYQEAKIYYGDNNKGDAIVSKILIVIAGLVFIGACMACVACFRRGTMSGGYNYNQPRRPYNALDLG